MSVRQEGESAQQAATSRREGAQLEKPGSRGHWDEPRIEKACCPYDGARAASSPNTYARVSAGFAEITF